MSQRGPGPCSASRRFSRSPVKSDQLSPIQYTPQSSSGEVRDESINASADASRHPQELPPKALGVHNILNPSEPRPASSEAGGRPPSRSKELETAIPPSSTPYGMPRPCLRPCCKQFATSNACGIGCDLSRKTADVQTKLSSHVIPAVTTPKQFEILGPRGPRSMSPSQTLPPRDLDPRHQPLAPSAPPAKLPYEPDVPDEPRPPPRLHQPTMAPSSHHPIITPPRTLSQPVPHRVDGPHVPPSGDIQGQPQVLHTPAPFQHGIPEVPTKRPLSSIGTPEDGASTWTEVLRRPGVDSAFVGTEAQHPYMILPGSDTPIPVQVDYSQASKKADEKRQRNAKASTRHRLKKKTLLENMKQLQDLKDGRQQMIQQLEDITQQRDFYRDERNRLRDLVSQRGLRHLVHGPKTPPLRVHIPSSQGYVSESSSVDHPQPRRRQDERPEFIKLIYRPPSGDLSAASPASGERLPPLRSIEGPPHPALDLALGHLQE